MNGNIIHKILLSGALFAGVNSASVVYAANSPSLNTVSCPSSELYFCDDFSNNNTNNWDLLPRTINSLKPDGAFDIVKDGRNDILRYTAASSGGVIALAKPQALSGLPSSNYYVEAKIRPRMNQINANKQLYLLARYQDGNNWYAGVLNVQNSINNTQVEIAKMTNGTINRMTRVKSPIVQGEKGALDGQWYTLRFVVKGDLLTVYLDGDKISSVKDSTFSTKGNIGLWTSNKSFEIDDIKVGDADQIPAFLVLSPSETSYNAEVGDDAKVIAVRAKTEKGSDDSVVVTSSDPSVVEVFQSNGSVSLKPVGKGTATISFRSRSNLERSISATIAPQFVMPTATYGFTNQLDPQPNGVDVYEDTPLKITFDSPPTLGEGAIRIFRSSDDSVVDTINLRGESDAFGFGKLRTIKTDLVRINGNTVSISPHSNVLKQGVSYYVAIPKSVFLNATLAGQVFDGIGKQSGWTFTSRFNKPDSNKRSFIVDDNGSSADFRTVQGALNFVMEHAPKDSAVTITVKNGVYEEPLLISNKNNITIQGESRNGTIIRYKNNELMNSGVSARAVFLIENSDMITLENLTMKNTTLIGNGGQAEVIAFNSPEGRLIARNASFISEQDTLHLKGWTWFYNTLVAGNVDFIWGYSKASLFENSEIKTLGDSRGSENGGYILQARVQNERDPGFVFLNSRLTNGKGPLGHPVRRESTYLARSGGCDGCYDNVVFVNTKMDKHIRSVGWLNKPLPTPNVASANAGWREFNSMDMNGGKLDVSRRLPTNSAQISEDDVRNHYCSREQIFAGFNNGMGWNPMPDNKDNCGLMSAN